MIKLQLLLRHPGTEPELDPALRARLDELGIRVTGSGRASVSAEIDPARFAQLFGPLPETQAGFAPAPQATPALPVPPGLAADISLITVAPRHTMTNH